MFELISDRRIPCEAVADERVGRLLALWVEKRGTSLMPAWSDFVAPELEEHKNRLHILDCEGPGQFRFRVYGPGVTNPEARDMTGLTTQEYADKRFGGLITRHYQESVSRRTPIYRHVIARNNGNAYEYFRLILPLSDDGIWANMLLASPVRITVSVPLPSENWTVKV